jgi:glycerol-3-phosphate dehydrogenase subunit B
MTHDTVVVGAGLAGLTAALRLAEQGQRVLVLARGIGATHLSPPTIDVLGRDGDTRVDSPARSLPGFVRDHPEHPYARVSPQLIAECLGWFRARIQLGYVGGALENLLLPTAVGVPKPSALVPETMAAGDLREGGQFVFVGLRGFKDFYPSYLAANLGRAALPAPVAARALELAPPVRRGEAEVGGLAFARRLEQPELRDWLVRELQARVEPGERVGFPAVLGLDRAGEVWRELEARLERRVFEVATLPPSVPGIRLYGLLTRALREAGGRIVIGAPVVAAEAHDARVEAIVADSAARPVRYRARSFVLATGGFASRGLELDSFGVVREQVLGLPVAGLPEGRLRFAPRYFDQQPLDRAGIAVDERLRPVDEEGRAVYENVHAAGAILAGAAPWREHSGNGISLATGYAAAAAVLERAPAAVEATA